MTDRSLSELAGAEIVPNQGGPNGWLIRIDEGEYEVVNKSGKNTLLLREDFELEDTVSIGGIMVEFDLQADSISLHDGDNEVRVPADKQENVLWAVYDEDGPRLNRLFDSLYTPTVREGLMDQFMPRFRRAPEDVRKTEDGWLINEDILVSWDGGNHPVSVQTTHIVQGSTTVEADEDKEAREISMPSEFSDGDSFEATAPDGRTFDIEPVELRFLTTVGLILGLNPSNYDDDVTGAISDSTIEAFTDTRSGLHHNHGLGKHRIQDLGVTDECADMLWSNANDHTPLHEMALREQELKNAPIDVFEDAENDNARKWEKIHSTRQKAPIPTDIRNQLEEQFE